MSEFQAVSEAPYVSKLALQRMPFSPVTVPNEFFNGRHIRQCLMLVLHALRATSIPVFVQGQSGLGKSTLLQQLQWDSGESLRFIDVTPESSIDSLIATLINQNSQFDEPFSLPNDEVLVDRLSQQRKRSNTLPVLLIDDVEAISPQIITMIKVWLSWKKDGNALVQAVFTGKSKDVLGDLNVQQMNLPFLTGDEVGIYLLYRLRAVEYEGDFPFSENVVADIAKRSAGVPSEINALAHQFLLNGKLTNNVRSATPQILWKWLPILILAIMTVVAVVNRQQLLEWFNTAIKSSESQDKISSGSSPLNDQLAKVNAGNSEQMVKVDKDDAAARQQLAELLSKIPSDSDNSSLSPESNTSKDQKNTVDDSTQTELTSPPKLIEDPAEKVAPIAEKTTEQKELKPSEANPEAEVINSPSKVKNTAEQKELKPSEATPEAGVINSPSKVKNTAEQKELKPSEATPEAGVINSPAKVKNTAEQKELKPSEAKPEARVTKPLSLTVHDTRWVKAQSPKKYTYQMMSTGSAAAAERFIKQYKLTGPVAIFVSLRKGSVWYAVSYGIYGSKHSAVLARKKWTGLKSKLKPWLRSYASVQNQIMLNPKN